MAKQSYFVRGTSCKSCEVVIERELRKQPDIVSVNVSHAKREIQLETEGDKTYSHHELNDILAKHDYSVEKKDKGARKQRMNWQRAGAILVLVLALYVIFDRLGILRLSPSSAQPASYVGILVVGLIASLSSCTAVVGGLVAAVSSAVSKDQAALTPKERLRPHILFNVGRIGGFFVLGALIGLLGSTFQLSPTFNGVFVVFVAIFMIVIGINLLDLFPTPVIGMPKWLAHKVHDLAESNDPKAPVVLGALTFFLPCGFTQSMQLFALTLGNPLSSGMVMAVFALGTAPILLGIGSATAYASGATLKKVTQAAGVIVLILGISNVTNGMALLGFSPGNAFASPELSEDIDLSIVNGRQQIEMDVTSRGSYEPSTLTVQVGTPVDWKINGADFMGCADTLILSAFGVNERLKTGANLVQFTPTKTGRYTFSCSMGMIRGTMIVTE